MHEEAARILIEKSLDGNLLRELVGLAAQRTGQRERADAGGPSHSGNGGYKQAVSAY